MPPHHFQFLFLVPFSPASWLFSTKATGQSSQSIFAHQPININTIFLFQLSLPHIFSTVFPTESRFTSAFYIPHSILLLLAPYFLTCTSFSIFTIHSTFSLTNFAHYRHVFSSLKIYLGEDTLSSHCFFFSLHTNRTWAKKTSLRPSKKENHPTFSFFCVDSKVNTSAHASVALVVHYYILFAIFFLHRHIIMCMKVCTWFVNCYVYNVPKMTWE